MTSLRGNSGLQKLLAGLLVLFMADTILGGSIGLFFRGERHLILALTVIVASCLCFGLWHENRVAVAPQPKQFLWPLGFFLISMVWILPVPMFTTGDVAMALRDAQSLILLPVATLLLYAIADMENFIKRVLKIVVVLAVCLALFQLSLWLWLELQLTPANIPTLILEAVFKNSPSIFASWSGAPGVGYVRVLWVSSLWLIVAIFIAPLAVNRNWLFPVEWVLGMAIHVSYTRGIWLGVAVGVLLCTAAGYMVRALGKRSLMPINNWTRVVLGLTLAPIVVSTIEYAAHGQFGFLSRVVDYSQAGVGGAGIRFAIDESIVERNIQAELLINMWSERPWMGWGYGAYIPAHIRDLLAPYSYEMVAFALLMKLGVVGFTLYLVFWAGLMVDALRRASPEYSILFVGGLSAFLLAAHTNPFLFNFVGMSIVLFFLLWWVVLRDAFENK